MLPIPSSYWHDGWPTVWRRKRGGKVEGKEGEEKEGKRQERGTMEEGGNKKMVSSSKCSPRQRSDLVPSKVFLIFQGGHAQGTQPRTGADSMVQLLNTSLSAGDWGDCLAQPSPWFPEGSGPLLLPIQAWKHPETSSACHPLAWCLPFALL